MTKKLKKSGICRHFFSEKIYQIPNFPGFFSEKPETPIKITTEYSWNFVNILAKHFICPFKSDEFLNKVENNPKKLLKNSVIFRHFFRYTYSVFSVFSVSPRFSFFNTLEVSSDSKAAKRSSSIFFVKPKQTREFLFCFDFASVTLTRIFTMRVRVKAHALHRLFCFASQLSRLLLSNVSALMSFTSKIVKNPAIWRKKSSFWKVRFYSSKWFKLLSKSKQTLRFDE